MAAPFDSLPPGNVQPHDAQPAATLLVKEDDLRALGESAFMGLGLTEPDARDVCSILLLADLFGLSTHGFSRVESYGERLLSGGIRARPQIRAERLAPR